MIKRLLFFGLIATSSTNVFSQNNVPFTSSNLPIVVINTGGAAIPDDPKITADIGVIYNGPGTENHPTDPLNHFDGKMGIEIRGSSSQMFPKKQYGIELRDDEGEDLEASLLGMPEEEDWVLFAPYNDKTLIRDVLAYRLGRDLSQYSPRTRFCEVVLNDKYQGVYVVIENIKRDNFRVDINKLDPDENSGNSVTGGYIIKIDKTTGGGGDGWASEYPPLPNSMGQEIFFLYDTPEEDEITSEQKSYIQNFVRDFENALAGDDFADPVNGYAKYVDVDSFIDYFLAQELTKNPDAYRLSAFLHKQRDSDGGKLVMGPIWDFNLAFGNVDYCTSGTAEGFVFQFNNICDQDFWLVPFWWNKLFEDENFKTRLTNRWFELRSTKWQESVINDHIDSLVSILDMGPQQRNFTAWPVLGTYVWPNFFIGDTFESEIDWLRNWISQRLAWLDANIPGIITAVEEENKGERVTAYPNPFSSHLRFEYLIEQPAEVEFVIYDNMGRLVSAEKVQHDLPGRYTYSVDSDLPQSMYHYNVKGNGVVMGKGKLSKR